MMAAVYSAVQRPAPNPTVILPRSGRGMIRINRARRACSEHEKGKRCRFNSRSTVSAFKTITVWLKSGSSPRTLALS